MAAVWVKTSAELLIMDEKAVKRYAAEIGLKVKVGMDRMDVVKAIVSKYPSHKDVLKPVLNSHVPVPVLKAIFRKYDVDGYGVLDTAEWKRLFKDMHVISGAETLLLAKIADKSGDGRIDIDEFIGFVQKFTDVALHPALKTTMDNIVKCWDEMDTAGSGRLHKAEFFKYLGSYSAGFRIKGVLKAMWSKCQPAADGTVTLEDFWNVCTRWGRGFFQDSDSDSDDDY